MIDTWCHKLWIILILNIFDSYTSIIPLLLLNRTETFNMATVIRHFGGNYCAEAQSFQDGSLPSCITPSFPHLHLGWRCTMRFSNVAIKIREGLNSHFHARTQSVSWFEAWPLTPPLQKILFVLSNFPALSPRTEHSHGLGQTVPRDFRTRTISRGSSPAWCCHQLSFFQVTLRATHVF